MAVMGIEHAGGRTMGLRPGTTRQLEQVALRRLFWAGPVAVAAAVAATLAAWAVVVAVLPPVDPRFVELQAQSVAIVTSVLCSAAVPVFALVALLTRRPLTMFQVVSAGALVLSWVPDSLILSEPGATVAGVVALMLLHVVAAVAMVWTLCALTREA